MEFGVSIESWLNLKQMKMQKLKKDQRGLTLIELVIAIALTGIITAAITMSVFQVFTMNTRTSNRMAAVSQVQHAGFWVSPDVQMALDVDTESEFLKLTWIEGGTTNLHEVIYSLEAMSSGEFKILLREHKIDGVPDSTTKVAEYIDPAETSCAWDEANKILTFTVTANVGGQSETRVYEVTPRPGS